MLQAQITDIALVEIQASDIKTLCLQCEDRIDAGELAVGLALVLEHSDSDDSVEGVAFYIHASHIAELVMLLMRSALEKISANGHN